GEKDRSKFTHADRAVTQQRGDRKNCEKSIGQPCDVTCLTASESCPHPFRAGHSVRTTDPLAHVSEVKRGDRKTPKHVNPHAFKPKRDKRGNDPHRACDIEIAGRT